jgi:DNA-binding MarR family transcriptional regulator
MNPAVARSHFGALALAVADEIANASATHSQSGPAAAATVFLFLDPGLSIGVLAERIKLSHAGTVRLIDRLELEGLVERRRNDSDRRARFIHLTASGEELMSAIMTARDDAISGYLSALSPDQLSTLGALSQHLLQMNDRDRHGAVGLASIGKIPFPFLAK